MTLTSLEPAWLFKCADDPPQLMQKLGDAWTPLRDERPLTFSRNFGPHYVDGVLEPACFYGCDVEACVLVSENAGSWEFVTFSALAREYVQAGSAEARPMCDEFGPGGNAGNQAAEDAGADADVDVQLVPNIETHGPTGPLALRVRYYRDPQCQTGAITTDLLVE